MRCRVLLPMRRALPAGEELIPAGEIVEATAEEVREDQMRRFRYLRPLEEEREQRAQDEQRRREMELRGEVLFEDRTLDAVLEEMTSAQMGDLSLETAWKAATGYEVSDGP